MVTEEQVKELAYSMWQQEGCPEGKDVEHYYRAKQALEERENSAAPASTPASTLTRSSTPPKSSSKSPSKKR